MSEILARGHFVFRDADQGDDPILREILRATPLPGWVTLSYEREPDYFLGCNIEGDTRTILAHTPDGAPVGFFSRAVRTAWIGGRPMRLGYLGQLRLLPRWRGRSRVILRGFKVCRELLDDGRQQTPYYFTSILADNILAQRILTSGIKGMPTYLPLCGFLTLVAATHQFFARRVTATPYELRAAGTSDIDSLADLLQCSGRRYALQPCWNADRLRALLSVGWRPEHTLLLLKDGHPVACGTVWDQRSLRQRRVIAYTPALAFTRPLVSTALRLAGYPPLPPPGRTLDLGFLSHLAVIPGEEATVPSLLAGLLRLARNNGLTSVVLGLSE
ncbi:MAG: hypothetical protein GY948_17345, partial [Alphaproteobacteria bacterium]|nr:hypothetical protein [Alphaproteobacteria bacterium]